MTRRIPPGLRKQVLDRSDGRCAYCQSSEALLGVTFEVDHIMPLAAGGASDIDNLCLSCPTCNRLKAAKQAAPDALDGAMTQLFHPSFQTWRDHFAWSADGTTLVGLTATGRATITLLRMNRPVLVQMRRYWVALGLHPSR